MTSENIIKMFDSIMQPFKPMPQAMNAKSTNTNQNWQKKTNKDRKYKEQSDTKDTKQNKLIEVLKRGLKEKHTEIEIEEKMQKAHMRGMRNTTIPNKKSNTTHDALREGNEKDSSKVDIREDNA